MNWQEIRQHYPQNWLLIEAIEAHTEANKRVLDQIAVLDTFPDSMTAIQNYQAWRHAAPERELYVVHTDRAELEIYERRWTGVRGAR